MDLACSEYNLQYDAKTWLVEGLGASDGVFGFFRLACAFAADPAWRVAAKRPWPFLSQGSIDSPQCGHFLSEICSKRRSSEKPSARIPAGNANSPMPRIAITDAANFPSQVMG